MHSTTGEYFPVSKAISAVTKALRKGQLERPRVCELCGKIPAKKERAAIHAHHWNGYDHPIDIWWVCASCNAYLVGNRFHIGKVSKAEAIAYIEARKIKLSASRCAGTGHNGKRCGRYTLVGLCWQHRT